jgi:hypothetical protein
MEFKISVRSVKAVKLALYIRILNKEKMCLNFLCN